MTPLLSGKSFDAERVLTQIFPDRASGELAIKLESLAHSRQEILFHEDLLGLAYDLEDSDRLESAAAIYRYFITQHPNSGWSQKALERWQGMTGEGSTAGRLEFQGKRFLKQACDYRVIVPMMAAAGTYRVGRQMVWSSLQRSSASWWNRGRTAAAFSSGAAFFAETTVFTLASRGLQLQGGLENYWNPAEIQKDWLKAGLTLGVLKGSGFLGRWGALTYRRQLKGRPLLWTDRANLALLGHGMGIAGLVGAHRLETALGWTEASGAPWLDGLSSYLSLHLGGRLGEALLGRSHVNRQKTATSSELPPAFRPFWNAPPGTPGWALSGPQTVEIFQRPFFMSVQEPGSGSGPSIKSPARTGRPRVYSDTDIAQALAEFDGDVEAAATKIGATYSTLVHRIRVAEPGSPLRRYREHEGELLKLKSILTYTDELLADAVQEAYGHLATAAEQTGIPLSHLHRRIKIAPSDSPLSAFQGPKPENSLGKLTEMNRDTEIRLDASASILIALEMHWRVSGLSQANAYLGELRASQMSLREEIASIAGIPRNRRTPERYRVAHELNQIQKQTEDFLYELMERQRWEAFIVGTVPTNILRSPLEIQWYLQMEKAVERTKGVRALSEKSGIPVEKLQGFALGSLPTRLKDLRALAPHLPNPKGVSDYWQNCWLRVSEAAESGKRRIPWTLREKLLAWRRYEGPSEGRAAALDSRLARYFHSRGGRKIDLLQTLKKQWGKYHSQANIMGTYSRNAMKLETSLDATERLILREMILVDAYTYADFAKDFDLSPDQVEQKYLQIRQKLKNAVEHDLLFNGPLELLALEPRIQEGLSRDGIRTVAQLTARTRENLLHVSEISEEDIDQIEKVLGRHNRKLKNQQIKMPRSEFWTLVSRPLVEHRPYNADLVRLANAGIPTFYDLVQKTEDDLFRVRGMGSVKVKKVVALVEKLGLHLGMSLEPFDAPIEQLPLTPKLITSLRYHGIRTIADLYLQQKRLPAPILTQGDIISDSLAEWHDSQKTETE